jgi:hypothetical protein
LVQTPVADANKVTVVTPQISGENDRTISSHSGQSPGHDELPELLVLLALLQAPDVIIMLPEQEPRFAPL